VQLSVGPVLTELAERDGTLLGYSARLRGCCVELLSDAHSLCEILVRGHAGSLFRMVGASAECPEAASISLTVILLQGNPEACSALSSVELVQVVERVFDQDGRATDIGLGLIRQLPPEKMIPRMPLSTRLVPAGGYVAAYGYPRSQWHETANEVGPPDLAMNVSPHFHRGKIVEYLARGRGFSRWPHYVHDAETGGGISGGPLIDVANGAVCGVNSTGIDNTEFSTAVDIRVALDWAIPFANGRTLRSFAAEGVVELR